MLSVWGMLAGLAAMDPSAVPDRYGVEGDSGSCTLVLRAPIAPPDQVSAADQTASGFALVSPACSGVLVTALLWRFVPETGELQLIDGAGSSVFSARQDGRDWDGVTSTDVSLRLLRR